MTKKTKNVTRPLRALEARDLMKATGGGGASAARGETSGAPLFGMPTFGGGQCKPLYGLSVSKPPLYGLSVSRPPLFGLSVHPGEPKK
jgi:hypothetical protein